MNCQQCGKELEQLLGGHRPKQFCGGACRQKHFRALRQKAIKPDGPDLAKVLATAQMRIQSLEEENAELVSEVSRLRLQLDVEKRLLDNRQRPFKSWLRSQPRTPLIERLLSDILLPAQQTYDHYRYRLVHQFHASPEELAEFDRIWKLMLLSRP